MMRKYNKFQVLIGIFVIYLVCNIESQGIRQCPKNTKSLLNSAQKTKAVKDAANKRQKDVQTVGNFKIEKDSKTNFNLRGLSVLVGKQTVPIDRDTAMEFTVDKVNDILREKGVIKGNEKFPDSFEKTQGNVNEMRIVSNDYSKPIISNGKVIGSTKVNINIDKVNPQGYTGNGPDTSHIGFEISQKTDGSNAFKNSIPKGMAGHVFVDDSIL
jgi:hypothetical protein